MPIVANKARVEDIIDQKFCTPNRTVGAKPNGASTVPQYAGEIIFDTSSNAEWVATSNTTNSWVALTTPN